MNEFGSSERSKIRVYLLDDHDVVRRGLQDLLEAGGEIEVVGDSGTVFEAVPSLLALQPDVAILDHHLPDGSGLDVCRRLSQEAPGIASIILSSQGEDDVAVAAFGAGASGFLLKQLRDHRLIESVRRVASGQTLFSPAIEAPSI